KADAMTITIAPIRKPVRVSLPTWLSLTADPAKITIMARTASIGKIFAPGKEKGGASVRTSRSTKNQQAAQQRRYIMRTATLESTASPSNVPVMERAKANAV